MTSNSHLNRLLFGLAALGIFGACIGIAFCLVWGIINAPLITFPILALIIAYAIGATYDID